MLISRAVPRDTGEVDLDGGKLPAADLGDLLRPTEVRDGKLNQERPVAAAEDGVRDDDLFLPWSAGRHEHLVLGALVGKAAWWVDDLHQIADGSRNGREADVAAFLGQLLCQKVKGCFPCSLAGGRDVVGEVGRADMALPGDEPIAATRTDAVAGQTGGDLSDVEKPPIVSPAVGELDIPVVLVGLMLRDHGPTSPKRGVQAAASFFPSGAKSSSPAPGS